MPNQKKPKNKGKTDKPISSTKVAIITTVITASIGLIGTIAAIYFQNIYPLRFSAGLTQTADANPNYSAAMIPSMMPVVYYYANVEMASIYEQQDIASKVFDTVPRGTQVEVKTLGTEWLYVTYLKGENLRITGYVLASQFTPYFVPTETATTISA